MSDSAHSWDDLENLHLGPNDQDQKLISYLREKVQKLKKPELKEVAQEETWRDLIYLGKDRQTADLVVKTLSQGNDSINAPIKEADTSLLDELEMRSIYFKLASHDIESIKSELVKAVQAHPNNPQYHHKLGFAHLESNDFENAIKEFEKVFEMAPDDEDAYYWLGWSYEFVGRIQDAIELYIKGLKYKPYENLYESLARIYYNRKNWTALDELYSMALQNFPNNADFHYKSSINKAHLNDAQGAFKHYKKAMELDPTIYGDLYPPIISSTFKRAKLIQEFKTFLVDLLKKQPKSLGILYFRLGYILEDLDELQEAILNYEQAYKLENTWSTCLFNISLIMEKLGRIDEAINSLRELIKNHPKDQRGYFQLANFLAQNKQIEEAYEVASQGLKIEEKNASVQYQLGNFYLSVFDYNKAQAAYKKALEFDKNFIYAQHNYSWTFQKQGNYKRAEDEWRKTKVGYEKLIADSDTPDLAMKNFYIADISFNALQKEVEDSRIETWYKKAIEVDEEFVDAYIALVRFYQTRKQITGDDELAQQARSDAHIRMMGAYNSGLRLIRKKIEKIPSKSNYSTLGELYLLMNKYDDAMESFKESLKKDDQFTRAYVGIGVAQLKIENTKEAIINFKKALDLEPDDLNVLSNLGDAYRIGKDYALAEESYQRVLLVSPKNVDALMGIGDCYKILGDEAYEKKEFDKSEQYFTTALRIFEKFNDKGILKSGNASKDLSNNELSALKYSSGFAKVRLFEMKSKLVDRGLGAAERDFEVIQKTQPEYIKAQQALAKIRARKRVFVSTRKLGPWIIIGVSVLVLLGTQYLFYKDSHLRIDNYGINRSELTTLLKSNQLDSLQGKMESFLSQDFTNELELEKKVAEFIPANLLTTLNKSRLIKVEKVSAQPYISEVAYGFFTFGSLVFIIVGLFVKDITTLKFGSIEMAKNVVESASTSTTLDIKK